MAHMPKGMMLKSDGFASNIYDPDSKFTLRQFCAERRIEYADMGTPVNSPLSAITDSLSATAWFRSLKIKWLSISRVGGWLRFATGR